MNPQIKKTVQSRTTHHAQKHLAITASTLKLLSQTKPTLTIEQIATKRKTSPRNIYKLFTKYIKEDLINEQRELTDAGSELIKQAVQFLPMVPNSVQGERVRLHDLAFTIEILKKPKNWEKHRTTITKIKKYNPTQWKLSKSTMQRFVINNIGVRVTPKSVIIEPQDIFAKTINQAINKATSILEATIPQIENLFHIILEKERHLNVTIGREHIAIIFHPLAIYCKNKKTQLQVYDEQGTLRLITDDSYGLKELEGVSAKYAEDDMKIIEEDLKDKILNKFYPASQVSNMIAHLAKYDQQLQEKIIAVGNQLTQTVQLQQNTQRELNNLTVLVKNIIPSPTIQDQNKEQELEGKVKGYG